jgi:uncharacterized membrane protein
VVAGSGAALLGVRSRVMSTDRRETAKSYMQQDIDQLAPHDRAIVERFIHKRRIVRPVALELEARSSTGQRVADGVAATMGSWRFIIIQSLILTVWITANIAGFVYKWDPYPFILLNLMVSFQAAYAAPIIMMSQNRQAEKDRVQSTHDYEINTKAELEIIQLHVKIDELRELQWSSLVEMQQQQIRLLEIIVGNLERTHPAPAPAQ